MRKQTIFLLILLISNVGWSQRITFNHPFAPQEGLIKKVQKPYRGEICLNGSWEFKTVQLPKGVSFEEIKNVKTPTKGGWDKTAYKVPSPWNINGFTDGSGGDFITYPSYPLEWNDTKSGWLKKVIKVPANWGKDRINLHFEAVAGYAKVFVNGKEVGDHFDAFLPFDFDITDHIKAGQDNEILLWVAHGSLLDDPGKYGRRNYVAGSFWGKFILGIWQDAYLQRFDPVYISDTYIKPLVAEKKLELEVTVHNTTDKKVKFDINASVAQWINKNGFTTIEMPDVKWELGKTVLTFDQSKLEIEPNSKKVFIVSTKNVEGLDYWTPDTPNLYGLSIALNQKGKTTDLDYKRFGWREFKIKGTHFELNGKPFEVRGDSWHFMGIPQLTRRYAFSWYRMLKDNNANGVRLHAQVFPRFYLEMADEMGICILDETGIWSSDGGPKIDSEIYWEACKEHVKGLVLRDRNYPSVMGWSVCNETLPVTKHVFHAPQKLLDRNIQEINNWVAITRKYDTTRNWISGDGETQAETDLPTVIGHYGGPNAMTEWSSQNKPWGIGETGMGYYGTPLQISKINGDRAFESQLGRMEGLAGEAYELIKEQRELNASYVSIFNLAWYAVKPLALGLKDIKRASTPQDGIFFGKYKEGIPGYQPERLGPYTSTFNPGYDPSLPLYEAWPLLEAVKIAFSDNAKNIENHWAVKYDNTVKVPAEATKESISILSTDNEKKLTQKFQNLAVEVSPLSMKKAQLIIVDGDNPPKLDKKLISNLDQAIRNGSSMVIWGATSASSELIKALSQQDVKFYDRKATSYVVKGDHPILNYQNNKSLYFSELTKEPVSTISMDGEWVEQSKVVLKACNTDWRQWNYQREYLKTAKVYRSEREAKNPSNVIAFQRMGKGELIVSTIDLFSLKSQANGIIREMITNLGGKFEGKAMDIPMAINKDGQLQNALFSGMFQHSGIHPREQIKMVLDKNNKVEEATIGSKINGKYWEIASANNKGVWDFPNMNLGKLHDCVGYLSFWVKSPRSLTDLLIEPNMPRVDLHIGTKDAMAVIINGKEFVKFPEKKPFKKDQFVVEQMPLEKGWNHVLIKVSAAGGDWKSEVRMTTNTDGFLEKLETTVAR
ncbi:glycoside hydrolase family 2 protein [Flammeovirga aprica]|uniref:Glycoside hydrolase family 2 n=1 Tax=Flammeovirga aprica JL-4 TaxID=694437 RepID=A0A7X9S1U5_9BACT|nr:sugar-binding domain-containing protein [Flammeovirga aprica]NME72856.1 glycoside hydrolase family 2 [Flammeovirga aprica JL-4]